MKGQFEMTNGKTKVTVPASQVAALEAKGYKKVADKKAAKPSVDKS